MCAHRMQCLVFYEAECELPNAACRLKQNVRISNGFTSAISCIAFIERRTLTCDSAVGNFRSIKVGLRNNRSAKLSCAEYYFVRILTSKRVQLPQELAYILNSDTKHIKQSGHNTWEEWSKTYFLNYMQTTNPDAERTRTPCRRWREQNVALHL
jgi:hypothetical protein